MLNKKATSAFLKKKQISDRLLNNNLVYLFYFFLVFFKLFVLQSLGPFFLNM